MKYTICGMEIQSTAQISLLGRPVYEVARATLCYGCLTLFSYSFCVELKGSAPTTISEIVVDVCRIGATL